MNVLVEILLDSVLDVLKMVPLMLAACFLADYIIAKRKTIKSANSFGGIATGALLGIVPQCGISTGFAQLYVSGLVGLSVLMSVFISGSDEALIFAAGAGEFVLVIQIIITKILSGLAVGFVIYGIERFREGRRNAREVEMETCDEVSVSGYCGHGGSHDHDHEHSSSFKDIFLHSARNTLTITLYVFVSVLIINLIVHWVGMDTIQLAFERAGVFQPVVAAVFGLIPSCAISIFITQAYLSGIITFGALIAGLCSNTGYGIVVIFKSLPLKRALMITAILVVASVIIGEVLFLVQ